MKIGELAERTGVSVRSLRYYEEQGLLTPSRDPSGHRLYAASDVERVIEIQELFAAGFCSSVVREVLPGVLDPRRGDIDRVAAQLDDARRRLQSELRHIEQELAVLAQLRERLGLAPDTHVRAHPEEHDDPHTTTAAPIDHRDRRLR